LGGPVLIIEQQTTVELIKSNGKDEDVAFAAWVSNFAAEARNRPLERVGGLINFLYREKHHSPFEHGSFTYFVDCPIFVGREFMRHRTWSYNETSGRYKELEGRFYLPVRERPLQQVGSPGKYTIEPGTNEQYAWLTRNHAESYHKAWSTYLEGLERGIAKEVSRNVLPLGLYTQFYATANPLNVLKFLILRNESQALYEIRQVAVQIEDLFAEQMPLTYKAYQAERDTWSRFKKIMDSISLDELEALLVKEGVLDE
jgi:thymidylate synthase (FAD)